MAHCPDYTRHGLQHGWVILPQICNTLLHNRTANILKGTVSIGVSLAASIRTTPSMVCTLVCRCPGNPAGLHVKDYFGFPNSGAILGTINGLMTIGNFCGAPFLALGDVIGRRGVNFAGNIIVIIAALLQGLAPNLAALMVGRFLLGFGSSMASAPQYVAEIAPLHLRGRLVGFFGTFFQFGSVIMIGAMTGFTKCGLKAACASSSSTFLVS